MSFQKALNKLHEEDAEIGEMMAHHLDPKMLQELLEASGKASVRRRNLPAEQVIWLVVGMSLLRKTPIRQVVDRLRLALNHIPVSSSISDARKRLGSKPIEILFNATAKKWAVSKESEKYAGLQIFAVDGTVFNVPDSNDNRDFFGKHKSRSVHLGYPQVRASVLLEIGSRVIRSANFGPIKTHETQLSQTLLETLPENSICLMDRGFCSYSRFSYFINRSDNVHFLCRGRAQTKVEPIERLPDGSWHCWINKPAHLAKESDLSERIKVRVIQYKVAKTGKSYRLICSLLDWRKFPAKSLMSLYHKRWDIEMAFDEIKTDLLDRREALRSKTVDGIHQEIWANFLTYNLIRQEMAETARAHGEPVDRMGFVASLSAICDFFIYQSSDPAHGRLPERLRDLRGKIWLFRNPERRCRRTNPREVKCLYGPYDRKPSRGPEMASNA